MKGGKRAGWKGDIVYATIFYHFYYFRGAGGGRKGGTEVKKREQQDGGISLWKGSTTGKKKGKKGKEVKEKY